MRARGLTKARLTARYTRKIDLGASTSADVVDGLLPDQHYYLAVQAYNKVGVTGALTSRPAHGVVAGGISR